MPLYVGDIFKSNWLKAEHLQGREVTVTIETVGSHEFDDGKKQIVLTFVGKERPFGCNATNSYTIMEDLGYGDDAELWIGKKITLYPTKTSSPKGRVDCIRIRETIGAATAPAPAPVPPPPPPTPSPLAGQQGHTPIAESDIPF